MGEDDMKTLALVVAVVVGLGCVTFGPTRPAVADTQSEQPIEPGTAETGHEGYYYPELTSSEVYIARAKPLPDSDARRRALFVVALAQEGLTRGLPDIAIFAKGETHEKLIISALTADRISTLYQARAYLAHLTLLARATPVFRDAGVDDVYTFLDLLRLLGFETVTISDGLTYAHRIYVR
jgi:hypothetical protein